MFLLIPPYTPPDFTAPQLAKAPQVQLVAIPGDGVAPDNYHGTSNHPCASSGDSMFNSDSNIR